VVKKFKHKREVILLRVRKNIYLHFSSLSPKLLRRYTLKLRRIYLRNGGSL